MQVCRTTKQRSKQEKYQFNWKVMMFRSINDDIEMSKAEIKLHSSVAHWGAGQAPLDILHCLPSSKTSHPPAATTYMFFLSHYTSK
jgi:hypothetical protein